MIEDSMYNSYISLVALQVLYNNPIGISFMEYKNIKD